MSDSTEILYEVTMQVASSVYAKDAGEAVQLVRDAIRKGLDDELNTEVLFFCDRAESSEEAVSE